MSAAPLGQIRLVDRINRAEDLILPLRSLGGPPIVCDISRTGGLSPDLRIYVCVQLDFPEAWPPRFASSFWHGPRLNIQSEIMLLRIGPAVFLNPLVERETAHVVVFMLKGTICEWKDGVCSLLIGP